MDTVFNCLFLWPIQAVVEFLFLFFQKWTMFDCGLSIVLLSVAVNTLLLPLYNTADRWQREEKNLLLSMQAKLADIRAVFRGDERQMLISTFYRQKGFHPLLSLRSSVGLLMQIPFFLAAYLLLSHSDSLKGAHFWFLQDLGRPDGLLSFGGMTVNLLPLVMTAINILSSLVWARNLRFTDQVQLFVLAAVFLVLLYGSPSGLVVYWTISNLFSLGKNVVLLLPRPGRVFHILAIAGVMAVAFWTLTLDGFPNPRFFVTSAFALALVGMPWLWRRVVAAMGLPSPAAQKHEQRLFLATSLFLFVLCGVTIPLLLIAASPVEFESMGTQLFQTVLQAISLLVLVPLGLRAIAAKPVRRLMTFSWAGVAVLAVVFAFVLPPEVAMNGSFTSTDPQRLRSGLAILPSLVLVFVVAAGLFAAIRFRRVAWLTSFFGLGGASLLLVGLVSALTLPPPAPEGVAEAKSLAPVFPLTRTGHNKFLLFLDGAAAAALPEALEEVPGLPEQLEGFTWYQNTVSYSSHTLFTVPAMMGGPAYSPEAINARTGVPLIQKVNDALKTLPRLLGESGERVVVTDPSFANFQWVPDTSIFWNMKNVTALNLKGAYKRLFLEKEKLLSDLPRDRQFDYDILVRFSLFRVAPPALRPLIYYDGSWWKGGTSASFQSEVDSFSSLFFLSDLTRIDNGADTTNFFFNETNHDTGAFNPDGTLSRIPVQVPASDLARFGDDFTAKYTYGYRAAMAQVVKWIAWLKEEGVFDNTRIIIVADHGRPLNAGKYSKWARYRPLLLVKDYGSRQGFTVNSDLKTNADVPALLTAGLTHPVPARAVDDLPLVHEGPFWPGGQAPDKFVFTDTFAIRKPDARVDDNWVEVRP